MEITLSAYEQNIINKHAKEMSISPDDLADYYFGVVESNFEQDIQDIVNENYDDLVQEYNLDKED